MSVNILDSNRHLKSIAGGDIPIATNLNAGKVKPDGTTINVDQTGTISVNEFVGTTEEVEQALSGLEDGTTIYITDDNEGGGSVPIATTTTPGIVKPDGTSITVAQDGTITATAQSPSIATTTTPGIVKPDGNTITVTQDGTIASTNTTPIATTSQVGTVKPDGTDIGINSAGLLSLDPNKFKFDRKKLFPDGLDYSTDVRVSISSAGMIQPGGSKYNSNIYTFTKPGIYYVSVYGGIGCNQFIRYTFTLARIQQGESTPVIINQYYAMASVDTSVNIGGLITAKSGDRIVIEEENSDISNQLQAFSGTLFIRRIYGFDEPTVTNQWWQQQTIS